MYWVYFIKALLVIFKISLLSRLIDCYIVLTYSTPRQKRIPHYQIKFKEKIRIPYCNII